MTGPVLEFTAHQVKPCAVEIGRAPVRVGSPYRLWRLLGQCPEQSLLTRKGNGSLGHFLLQPGIELADLFQQSGIFYGGRSQVTQFQRHIFILFCEFAFVFVGQLEQADIFTVLSTQGHRDPAAHRRMFAGIAAKPAPAGMRF